MMTVFSQEYFHSYSSSSTQQHDRRLWLLAFLTISATTILPICYCEAAPTTSTTTTNTCIPNTLRISDNVHHRAPFLTIAHRGASFHLPEHTIPAYRLALELGADFIEPDVVVTKDARLVALHSLDLNVTTNVASVFGVDRPPWFSPFANKTGYWTFNFTYDEISQLTLRQRLPAARSTFYDGTFKIPTLEEILDTINTWNRKDLPQLHPPVLSNNESSSSSLSSSSSSSSLLRRPTAVELAQSGIYVELKDPEWIKQEVGVDIVDLMYQHFEQHTAAWSQLLSCYDELRYDEYTVPGLVIQSFDGNSLKDFHDSWSTRQHPFQQQKPQQQGDDNDSSGTAATTAAPEPPYVLLVEEKDCKTEEFWLHVGDSYRKFIQGIGPAKECLLSPELIGGGGDKKAAKAEEEKELAKESFSVIKAREFGLVLHPWTERPEQSFLAAGYDSIWDEMLELICRVGVQGIFTEAVSTAIAVAKFGCNDERYNGAAAAKGKGSSSSPSSSDVCNDSDSSSSSWVTIATGFVLGICVSAVGIFAYLRLYTNNVGAGVFLRHFSQIEPSSDDVDAEEDNNRSSRGNGAHTRDIA
jgi:glycerophosphoryl diester phosphodiesterase